MRAVFSATRRSPASATISATSLRTGARRQSRAVLSTGSRRASTSRAAIAVTSDVATSDVETSLANVIAWAPAKNRQETERGDRHAGLPFWSPFGPAGSTAHRRTSYDPPYYWAAASLIGRTETKTRPLVLVRNSSLPLIRANNV